MNTDEIIEQYKYMPAPLPIFPSLPPSPHYEKVNKRVGEWLTGLNAFDNNTINEVLSTDFTLASCLVFPQGTEDMLFYITKYYAIFTIVDDIVEKDMDKRYLFDDLMSFLRNGYATGNLFSLLHKEIREEMKLSKKHTEVITFCYERFIESVLKLYSKRGDFLLLTIPEYYRYRKWDVEVAQDFALHDYNTGGTITKEMWDSPIMDELLNAYCENAWLVNDYISFQKDIKDKNFINIIFLLAFHKNLSLEDSLREYQHLLLDSVRQLDGVGEKFNKIFPFTSAFVNAVKQGAYGYYEFQMISRRYKVT